MLASVLAVHFFGATHEEVPARQHMAAGRDMETPSSHRATSSIDAAESALVDRVRTGDESAMRDLVMQYANSLTRFAYTIVHTRDVAEAIAYDVLSDVWIRRDGLRSDRSLGAYLFTAVRRRAWDEMERAAVRGRYEQRVTATHGQTEELEHAVWTAPSPESLFLDRDDADAQAARITTLRDVITQLPARRRMALHLRFEQGLSYPAMGEVLGLSDKAAQQLVLRTIAGLRKALGL